MGPCKYCGSIEHAPYMTQIVCVERLRVKLEEADALKARIAQLERDLDLLKGQLDADDTSIYDLYVELKNERDELRRHLDAYSAENARLKEQVEESGAAIDTYIRVVKKFETERDADRAAIRALASLGGHQHWDPQGTSGANCQLCMERIRVKDAHAAAIARAQSPPIMKEQ